jgi:hypothetical protein
MDLIALITLRDEMNEDCRVAAEAARLVQLRFAEPTESGLEACAHYLARFYNIVEQLALRTAKAFENNIDDDRGWHTELVRRLSISIQGIRPALFPQDFGQPLRELRAFRHVFTHAYDLQLDRDKLQLLLKYCQQINQRLRVVSHEFIRAVARQEDLNLPEPAPLTFEP